MRVILIVLGLISLLLAGFQADPVMAKSAHLDRLIQDAASGSESVRLHAIDALGQSDDPRALKPLLTALRDANPTIRERAHHALQTLSQTLRKIHHSIARWIDTWLITLDSYLAPPLQVERTQHKARGLKGTRL